MNMDWIAARAEQDQSMEALLAKRNLERQMGQLLDVARASEQQRSNRADEENRAKNLTEQAEYRKAVQAQTAAERDRMQREREIDNKRARYSAGAARRKPGDRIIDPQVLADIQEFEGSDQLTPDEKDPTARIYRKHEFEQEQLKLKQQEEIRKAQEARAKEDQAMQREQLKLSQDAAKRAEQREQRAQKDAERRQKALDAKLQELPGTLKQQAAKEAQMVAKSISQGMFESDEEYAAKVHAAIDQVYSRVREQAVASGLLPPNSPKVEGNGTKPGDAYLSDEEVKQLFPNLPPGARVKRVS
jgi:hypothetical protein